MNPFMLDVNEANFEQEVLLRSHEVPVVVDFWAEWCGPCKVLGPILERLAIEGGGRFILAKINVDQNPGLAMRFGVQGIPAVKAFKQGKVEAEFVGSQPEPVVRRFIQRLIPSPAEQAAQAANSLLVTHHWKEAEEAFREALAEDGRNAVAALGLMKSLLMQGRGGEALALLEDFPPGSEWAIAEQLRPLADLLAAVENNGPGYDEQDPLAAELYQAGRLIVRDNLPAAMDGLLDILRQDKRYRDGLPRKILLAIFSILGDEDTLTRQYREELASVLF